MTKYITALVRISNHNQGQSWFQT